MTNEKTWCVANNNGDLIAHDVTELEAKNIESLMKEKEPEAEWEAINSADKE